MSIIEAAREVIMDRGVDWDLCDEYGAEVHFYVMWHNGEEVGVKVFRESRGARRVEQLYATQKMLHDWDLAPAVLTEIFECGNYYCYVTQLADMTVVENRDVQYELQEEFRQILPEPGVEEGYYAWKEWERFRQEWIEERTQWQKMGDELQENLRFLYKEGLLEAAPRDFWPKNYGVKPGTQTPWLIDMGCVQRELT